MTWLRKWRFPGLRLGAGSVTSYLWKEAPFHDLFTSISGVSWVITFAVSAFSSSGRTRLPNSVMATERSVSSLLLTSFRLTSCSSAVASSSVNASPVWGAGSSKALRRRSSVESPTLSPSLVSRMTPPLMSAQPLRRVQANAMFRFWKVCLSFAISWGPWTSSFLRFCSGRPSSA